MAGIMAILLSNLLRPAALDMDVDSLY